MVDLIQSNSNFFENLGNEIDDSLVDLSIVHAEEFVHILETNSARAMLAFLLGIEEAAVEDMIYSLAQTE